jgi:hypothetical protein
MSFDISRSTFRPRKNFLGVVMQQGRVQLDSDWNEWQSEFSRRIQAGTLDTVGRAVYSASTPNAFKITAGTDASGGPTLSIGAGRYYVDGLLAENHGPKAQAAWDSALAELSGAPAYSTTTAITDYTKQPFLPGAVLPTDNGPFLAYLDVWQRDVTYLEDPDLIDKAINIDTTGRLQTVWQVKLLDLSNLGTTPDCSTDVPAFDALQQPPAARLTNGLVPNANSGPCCLAPNTSYTGQENQLYRVEIHQAGAPAAAPAGGYIWPLPANTPTFKWSRDNASVETSVSAISTVSTASGSVSQLTVASLGRDQVLGFSVNNWIEITDDAYELYNQPGEFFQIATPPSSARAITLNGAVSSHFPLTGGQTNPKLHTRIRRWDQSGKVYQTDSSGNTTLWIDLNAPGSTGQIPVPPAGTMLVLENGITVSFDLNPEPTSSDPTVFRAGDYWLFAARTADGSVEQITSAPPLGIHHHYAQLSVVTFPGTASDCRVEWPPSESGCDCCCTITLSPSDITGNTTLQSVLDQHQNQTTPTIICLEAGTYNLPAPLRLTSAHKNITIEACQPGSARIEALQGNESSFSDGMIVLDGSSSITFTGLTMLVPVASYSATTFAGQALTSIDSSVASMVQNLLVCIGIRIVNGISITITQCAFGLGYTSEKVSVDNSSLFAAGIFLNGQSSSLKIESNEFIARTVDRPSSDIFTTGVLLASSVSFGIPTTIFVSKSESEKNLTAAAPKLQARAATAAAQAPAQAASSASAKSAAPSSAQIAANSPTLNAGSTIERPVEEPGLQNIGGQLQNIYSFGNVPQSTLASQGGTVLAATLETSTLSNNSFFRLTAAALLLGEPGDLDAISNTTTNCRAGLWIVAPALVQALLTDPQSLALLGATVALGYPLPQGDTSTLTTVTAAPASTYIYAGVNNYTDSSGNVWVPDTSATNVTVSGGTLVHPAPPPTIGETADQPLYQSDRQGTTFSYTFNSLPSGFYTLTLKFAEITYLNNAANSGVRIFNVTVNGLQVLTDLDVAATTGGALLAYDQVFPGIVPNSAGQIVVQFTGTDLGTDPNAIVSGASLSPLWTGNPYLGSGNESASVSFFDQLAQLAWQGYATLGFTVARLRVQNNELHNLTAPGVLIFGSDSTGNGNSASLMMTANCIDGEVTEDSAFANVAQKDRAGLDAGPSAIGYFPNMFFYLVVIVSASRAVVSANMVTNGNLADGYEPSLYLHDTLVQKAVISVMSNTLAGSASITPGRGINDSTLDAILLSWNFLNTIVVG